MSEIRSTIGIASVEKISEKAMMIEAWKRRKQFQKQTHDGPVTRGQSSGNVVAPDQRSWAGKTTQTKATLMWNKLPEDVRSEDNARKARKKIKMIAK